MGGFRTLLYGLAGLACIPRVSAVDFLRSTSLQTCQQNSGFSASRFSVLFTRSTNVIAVNITASSSIEGSVVFDFAVFAYGYQITHQKLDPCVEHLSGFCPMIAGGNLDNSFNFQVDPSDIGGIPSIAYEFPDIDAKVQVHVNRTDGPDPGESVACVEADISNGKTVDLVGVKWAAAAVTFLALISSAVISNLGHPNAASHVAASALSLCGYFQAQAMIGLVGVPLPPVVQAWTQDFQWSMGIIRLGFMQKIFTWYQRSTGGTPSTLFNSLGTISVQVQKRAASAPSLLRRGNIENSSGSYVVYGIQRAAFRAHIESTNLFMTCLTWFCVLLALSALCVLAFKGFCQIAARAKWIDRDNEGLTDFRNGWRTVLKGVLFRMTLIGYPLVVTVCLWEFTQDDSAAEMVLAAFFLCMLTATLGWGAFKVIRIARRSKKLHRNPAYILYSDPQTLNKWGFLYIHFRASAAWLIAPSLGYTLVKCMFIALAQPKPVVQAIAFILIEAAALITTSVMKPWMDKPTNSFNIAICVVNFVNAICLLFFTDVFDQPGIITGVIGVAMWILNAAFTLILLLMLIISAAINVFHNNPDVRYQFMGDDRTSFMKSSSMLQTTTELDALGVTARGMNFDRVSACDSNHTSIHTGPVKRQSDVPSILSHESQYGPSHSPMAASRQSLAPSARSNRQSALSEPLTPSQDNTSVSLLSAQRAQNNSSPWQKGAGYDNTHT